MARIIGLKDYGNGQLEYREQQVRFWLNEKQLVLAMVDFLESGDAPKDDKHGGMKLNREFLHKWIRTQLFENGQAYLRKLEAREVFKTEDVKRAHELVKLYLTEKGMENKDWTSELGKRT